MRRQDFAHHVRYYPVHHFVFYPLLLAGMIFSYIQLRSATIDREVWAAILVLFGFTGWLSFMMRQHYALGNQDRILRLELRFRYFLITGKRLEAVESKLSFRQLAALRFASDEELAELTEKAVKENLSPRDIKQSIRTWLPDHMRV